jgi:hypothetical protein
MCFINILSTFIDKNIILYIFNNYQNLYIQLEIAFYFKQHKQLQILLTNTHKYDNRHYHFFEQACILDNMKLAEFLLQEGIGDPESGLSFGCQYGKIEIIRLMKRYGANDWCLGYEVSKMFGQKQILKQVFGIKNY